MGWTTPKTWATSETVTASDLNVYVRDDLSALYDLIAGSFGQVMCADPFATGIAQLLTANRCYYGRVIGTATITSLWVEVVTSAGNISVATYANNGSLGTAASPAGRLATSGSVACPGTGASLVSLGGSVDVLPEHWMALSGSSASTQLTMTDATNTDVLLAGLAGFEAAAHPAPATATMTNGVTTPPFLFGF